MGYRDESEGLRAKLALREEELAQARAKIALLEGQETPGKANPFLGSPTKLVLERTFDVEMSDELLEKIVRILRERSDNLGRLDRVGDTAAWSSTPQGNSGVHPLEVVIERRGLQTYVSIRERLGPYAGGIFGGLLGGLGGGGLPGVIGLSFATGLTPLAIPMVAAAWIGAVYLGARGIYGKVVRRHHKKMAGTMSAIAELVDSVPTAVRVETPAEREAAPAPLNEELKNQEDAKVREA